jgi:S1-C subfamily serine protease
MAIDGKPTGNIYEYMNRLKTLQKGQRVSVDIQRDGQNQILIIQL